LNFLPLTIVGVSILVPESTDVLATSSYKATNTSLIPPKDVSLQIVFSPVSVYELQAISVFFVFIGE
jgi:hypothetical protein